MESVPRHSAHRALLSLERSFADPAELLDEAARILGVGYDEIRDDLFTESEETLAKRSIAFAPKEEWTLRWLLKKTKPAAKNTSPGSEFESSANDDPRKWLLFCHIVCRMPLKKLAKTLREQDAMRQIQDALVHLVREQKRCTHADAVSSTSSSSSHDLQDGEYELPQGQTKKRKRSAGPVEPTWKNSTMVQILLAILRALNVCLHGAVTADGEDTVTNQHMRMALSLTPDMAAVVLENLDRLANKILEDSCHGPVYCVIIHHLYDSLQLWDIRRGADLGHTMEEVNDAFTSHCLVPCLSTLKWIRHRCFREEKNAALEACLEKLVALHAIRPARKAFFDELAATWKSDQDPLLSEHIKPTVDFLQRALSLTKIRESALAESQDDTWSFYDEMPILFDIAIRSCPRNTVRRAQHEQPWLETVFVCLAHVTGCSLIDPDKVVQREDRRDEWLRSKSSQFSRQIQEPLRCLEALLSTAIQWKISMSLPILCSLTLHFSGLRSEHQSTNWTLVANIMQLDINVFLPNSGLSNSRRLHDLLIEELNSQSNILARDRNHALDHLSLVNLLNMLMNGFASARDLATFVEVWMVSLAAVENRRSWSLRVGKPITAYSLWDDEDFLAEFARVAKTSAAASLIELQLAATIKALRDKDYGGMHYARAAVLDLLLAANEEEIRSAGSVVKLLYLELQDALCSDKASGKLIGWLWRLRRHIFPYTGRDFPSLLFKDLVDGKENPIVETAVQHVKVGPVPYLTSMICFNDVERFHCFVRMVALHSSAATQHLDREIKVLTSYLVELKIEDGMKASFAAQLWNGRATSLESRLDLSAALVGILLQNSQVLCLNIETTTELLTALSSIVGVECESSSTKQPGLASLFEALILDKALITLPGFVKKCIKATRLLDEGCTIDKSMRIIQALPKEAMSKAQRKQVFEWQTQMAAVSQRRLGDLPAERTPGDFREARENMAGVVEGPAMTYGELQFLCRKGREAASLQTPEEIKNLCTSFRKEENVRPAKVLLLGSMLNKGDTISPHVTGLAADLSSLLPNSTSLHNFCLVADCIKIILDQHHDSVNQWTIDHVLACIAISLSPRGPKIVHAAPIIFERLCRILGVVLGRYRIRLGGRYHLLLPVLHGLLRCVFALSPQSMKSLSQLLFHSKLPPWMQSEPNKLSKDSSVHLTRLLTSICDPTPSSVKRSHNPLTDETKKARRVAGEYMQYFIAEYASCKLDGRIEAGAKEGLMPGLYAVLDVMGREVMRGMNAKMDASRRAIFKGLYEDWMKFGRWNGM
jgi:Urb2/Npa2 family